MKASKTLTLIFLSTIAMTIAGLTFLNDEPGSENITGTEMQEHISYLASDELQGRFPGTEGDDLTTEYLVREFEKYKLKPAGENGYQQEFKMYTHVRLSGENTLKTMINGKEYSFAVESEFMPLGFSGSGFVGGDLAFAGYGISTTDGTYNDYTDANGNPLDVKGKILLVMRYSPGGDDPHSNPFEQYERNRFKAMKAKEMGASGLILFNGPSTGSDDKLVKMSFDNVTTDVGIPVISCKREIAMALLQANGIDIKAVQENIDKTKKPNSTVLSEGFANITVNVEPVEVTTDNVLGMIEGSDPTYKDEIIVIGAHKDHLGYGLYGSLYAGSDKQIHNGADDNASGTAGMLEIAQRISSVRNDLKRSFLFMAFGGEEAGLLGSAHFVKSPLFKDKKVVAMLNMDMIGRLESDKLIIYGTGSSPYWKTALDSLNANYNFNVTYSDDASGRSDHASFYNNNVPSLHFFTGTHKDYHSPSDDVYTINSEGAARVASMVYDVAMALDDLDAPIEFTKVVVTSKEGMSMGSVKVYVGTIPDYSYSSGGMKISGVKDGSPAHKGGLQAEDIIIKFGDVEVNDIYGYMYAMSGYKPGDEVEIIVKRKEENVPLKVTLGSR